MGFKLAQFVTAAGAIFLIGVIACGQGDISSQDVASAVRRGVAHLRQTQDNDGTWGGGGDIVSQGITGLNTLALLNAGVSAANPAVARGLAAVAAFPNSRTYVVAIKCQALAAGDPKKYQQALREAATFLAESQLPNGMWTYAPRSGRGDNSNTQFALLGLHEAARAGVNVGATVWQKARKHFENTQLSDGGWSYNFDEAMLAGGRQRTRGSYGSMTAAGVASLFICGQTLQVAGPREFVNGRYPSCGRYRVNTVIAAGLNWLATHFTVTTNPGKGTWHHYYLYALERVGMLSGVRAIGRNDWYRQGASLLVRSQRFDGSWLGEQGDTAFALLFLAKGNRPVLIQKVEWTGQWNRNLNDLENLTAFLGDKLGKAVTWQTTSLEAPLEQLRAAPILFISGHEFPKFTAEQNRTLRDFVRTGGTLLFDACCGSQPFRDGFRAWAAQQWPDNPSRPLAASHPVFSSLHRMADTYGLEGINDGCRTGVFFSPNALSCLWELQTIPTWSPTALQLGANVAAYATGRQPLGDKLDTVELPPGHEEAATQQGEIPRGAVRLGRLVHDGDWNADRHALVNLCQILREQAKLDVVAQDRPLKADDAALLEYPVVFMTGHHAFELSEKEQANLRLFLRRGGTLVAESCCGQKAFDESFRALAGKLFPDHPLAALPLDHPIFSGKVGLPLGTLSYRPALAEELKITSTQQPPLEAVLLEGRTAILYSPYDFSCALEGDSPFSCRGYNDADGRRLALILFLYAISY